MLITHLKIKISTKAYGWPVDNIIIPLSLIKGKSTLLLKVKANSIKLILINENLLYRILDVCKTETTHVSLTPHVLLRKIRYL